MKAIEINRLTKCYGKARGVTDMSLTVDTGEFFGFIGPNGAGKSTTIRTLLGLIKPSSGFCSVLGHDCVKEKDKVLKVSGYLPSENAFYPGMKVKEVIRMSAELRGVKCDNEARRLCDALELNTEKKTAELSYGNRKKLSIVCALQHMPEILILDEPTGGLDPLMQRTFFEILRERNKAGATIFFSSHILSEVQNNCERTAIIKEGKIIACDKVENLKDSSVKKVTVTGNVDITGLVGVKKTERYGETLAFLYSGDMNRLMKTFTLYDIRNLLIEEPNLEEVFMHYYEDGELNTKEVL